ncbi:phenylacetaldehyde reductase-like [Rutidosis leptorrhynchoides]|uniref:phenylacetaldehyde reductase-like n=1 Tax=Rutidosis leptorrhynchoides TaxID=125765 RepID=UPI003A99054C
MPSVSCPHAHMMFRQKFDRRLYASKSDAGLLAVTCAMLVDVSKLALRWNKPNKLILRAYYFQNNQIISFERSVCICLYEDRNRVGHLLRFDGAKERLHLFKANLRKDGSFDAAVEGCVGVFHTDSPYYYEVTDPQAQLIDPAVKGMLNVLGSCSKALSVKRVVVTSSFATVAYNGRPRTPEVVVDETWFSDSVVCEREKMWCALAKTLAEDAAWKFAKENDLDIVTINPAMVIGPMLQTYLDISDDAMNSIAQLCDGSQTYPNASLGWVNVKDVANAHILAFKNPSARGRYCLVERVVHYSEIVEILRNKYRFRKFPDKCEDDKPFVPTYQVSKEKVKSLGINNTTSLEQSIMETVESLYVESYIWVPS